MLDTIRRAIENVDGGASKSDVLAATGITESQWTKAVRVLLASGRVVKTGERRGSKYHVTGENDA